MESDYQIGLSYSRFIELANMYREKEIISPQQKIPKANELELLAKAFSHPENQRTAITYFRIPENKLNTGADCIKAELERLLEEKIDAGQRMIESWKQGGFSRI